MTRTIARIYESPMQGQVAHDIRMQARRHVATLCTLMKQAAEANLELGLEFRMNDGEPEFRCDVGVPIHVREDIEWERL